MANEITLSISLSATNPEAISVAHSVSGKQFNQTTGKKDVFKESVEFSTTYNTIPLGDVAYVNKAIVLITNRTPVADANYLWISLDSGTTTHQIIPANGTTVLWPGAAVAATAIKAKYSVATAVAEITCVESDT